MGFNFKPGQLGAVLTAVATLGGAGLAYYDYTRLKHIDSIQQVDTTRADTVFCDVASVFNPNLCLDLEFQAADHRAFLQKNIAAPTDAQIVASKNEELGMGTFNSVAAFGGMGFSALAASLLVAGLNAGNGTRRRQPAPALQS